MNPDVWSKSDYERKELIEFLFRVEDLLRDLVLNDDNEKFFEPELIEKMRAAWAEMGPYFSEAHDALAHADAENLRRHGLVGEQLKFKLAVVNHHEKRFKKTKKHRWLRRLLNAMDDFLKSILDAAGVGGAIDELKAMIGRSVKDGDKS